MELKDKILATAMQLFWEHGLKRVSIDDICRELRVSKKTFYSIFESKSSLIEAVLELIRHGKYHKFEVNENENIIEYLVAKGNMFRSRSQNDAKHAQIYFDLKKYYPALLDEHIKAIKQHTENVVLRILEVGMAQGLFRKDLDLHLMKVLTSEMYSILANYAQAQKIPISRMIVFGDDILFRIACNERGMECYRSLLAKRDSI